MSRYSNGKGSSSQQGQKPIAPLVPKPEMLDFDFIEDALYSRNLGDNIASSSSGSNVRSFFVGMGFLPSLVDKVIEEKGEDDTDLLLETLIQYSDLQKEKSQSSGYLDNMFVGKNVGSCPQISAYIQPKEEPDVFEEDFLDKRASLLQMHFSVNEVDFALEKLGEGAPVNELVDFITAAQLAEKLENEENESEDAFGSDEENNQNTSNDALFGTMEKTLHLLEMGFSENEVSIAIEKFGSEVPITELADAIFTGYLPSHRTESKQFTSIASGRGSMPNSYDTDDIKTEDCSLGTIPQSRDSNLGEPSKGKRPKEESSYDFPVSHPPVEQSIYDKKHKGKKPRQDYVDNTSSFLDPAWFEEKVDPNITRFEMPRPFKSNSCKSVNKMVFKPPYFLYGNLINLSYDGWAKVSQFLYGIEPEIVNTRVFSAFNRQEGYVHNLPTENRFHILPKSSLTIQDAIPHTKKWWPPWDTRTQLSCMGFGTLGVSSLCERLGKTLADCRGMLSSDEQKNILRQCQISNLIWTGTYKLSLAQPEHWEQILGYPLNHTQAMEDDLTRRIQLLQQSFQTDTLGYHLSVLKSMYPGGLTVLSIFSGIGGAVVALHQLGIRLKGVISVESSEACRSVLRNWWHTTGQTGELVMIEDIQKLTIKRLESLIDKLGGIDFVICQNSNIRGSTNDDMLPGFDFSLFNEFVRVLQRVRSMMERRS